MRTIRRFWLEGLLAVAVVALVGQLLWPSAVRWWQLPRPGGIGIDQLELAASHGPGSSSLAPSFLVYLPKRYGQESRLWPLVVFLHGSGERGSDPRQLYDTGPLVQLRSGYEIPTVVAVPDLRPERCDRGAY